MSKLAALPVSQTQLALSSELVTSARAWRKTADQALSGFGISSSAALPLLMIGRLGDEGVRQVTLAHALGIEGPSLVRVLDQLCATQLARRDDDPADGRAKIVSLTQSGRDLVGRIEKRLNALRERVLKDVSATELEITLRVMRRFSEGNYEPAQESVQETEQMSHATRAASHPASPD